MKMYKITLFGVLSVCMTRHRRQTRWTISRLVVAGPAHMDTLPGEWRRRATERTAGAVEPQQDRRENSRRDAAGLQQKLSEVALKRWREQTRTKLFKIFAFCSSHWLVGPKLWAKTDKTKTASPLLLFGNFGVKPIPVAIPGHPGLFSIKEKELTG